MSDSHRPRAEPGVEPLTHENDRNLLIQQAINAILRISLEPISLDQQMHRVLDLLLQLPWLALEHKGCIYLADEEARLLVMKAHIGMPAGLLSTCSRVPFGICLCGRAIAANEIVFANRVDACHNIRYAGIHPHGHYCVPISSGERRLGLLNLYVREGHQQYPDEEHFLRAVADVLAGVIERQRTQERLQEQLRLAAFGKDVGLALSQGDGLPAMLRQCAEAMIGHLDGALARIWTLNEADNVLELQASAGLYTRMDGAHRRVPVGQSKIGRIAQERKPHRTNAVLTDPRVHDQQWARREGLVAFAGYPLLVADRLVGVMAMFARQPLSEATLEAMASVANALALGIERTRTQERLQEQLDERKKVQRRLAAEHGVSRILAVSHNFNDAALSILQALCESLGWDVGTLWVVAPKDNVLRCVAIWHRPGVAVATFEEVTRQGTFAAGVGMPGRVWASAKLVWVPDVSGEANFPRRQVAVGCGLHGAVGFPIRDGRQVHGVLEFFSREIREPDAELGNMMTSIGRQISQFIERRQAQEHLAAIVESSDDAIIGKTLDGAIWSWNQGAERLYGYSAEEVQGKSISLLIPANHPDELPGIMERLQRGEGINHYETVRVRKDGRRVEVSVSISPIRDAAGHLVGASAIARDITERRKLRQQEEDRRIARQIQQGLLPKAVPTLAGFQISGRSMPAQDVGGDCFDFLPLRMRDEECLGVVVADASGHGIGAALLVAQTRAYLRALALASADVGTLLRSRR